MIVIVSEEKTQLGRYFSFYNKRRPHQSLDGQTPNEIYFNHLMQQKISAGLTQDSTYPSGFIVQINGAGSPPTRVDIAQSILSEICFELKP